MLLKKTANHKMPSLKDLENKAKEKAAQSDGTDEEEGAAEAHSKDSYSENKDSRK